MTLERSALILMTICLAVVLALLVQSRDDHPDDRQPPRPISPTLAQPHSEPTRDLAAQNQRLQERISQLERELAAARNRQPDTTPVAGIATSPTAPDESLQQQYDRLNKRLEAILSPTDKDLLSSTVKAELAVGEVLVTGGYADAAGRIHYLMVQPAVTTLDDGSRAIRIQARNWALDLADTERVGLDSMLTTANNTIQHGEVWSADEFASVTKQLAESATTDLMTSPTILARSGSEAIIQINDLVLNTTATTTTGSDRVDLQLRIEQPRAHQKQAIK